jgi:hypothetical protein
MKFIMETIKTLVAELLVASNWRTKLSDFKLKKLFEN